MKILYLLVLICLIVTCNSNMFNSKLVPGKSHFEYFKYSGDDSFFEANKLKDGQYYNPVLPGFYPDPSLCKKGDDYYLVTSSFSFFPGVPVFHSKDLVNWEQIGHVLDRPSQFDNPDQPVSYGIFAPAISYNPKNETFYMVTTFVGGKGNFVVTAKDPAGPWSEPFWLKEVEGIDPSLFFDDDGRAWLVNNGDPEGKSLYEGHKAIWIQEFDMANNQMIGPRKVIRNAGHNIADKPIWIEGPHLYKINGYYYLMAAEGGTSIGHSEVIFRSKNVLGPYETNPQNPILTQRDLSEERENPVTNTGHADIIQTTNGDWYAVFLACRPYKKGNIFNIGRETFLLPVNWQNNWPVILEEGKQVPMINNLPVINQASTEAFSFMKRGNFSYTDNFADSVLSYEWIFLRTPKEKWYEFDKPKGGILIDARDVNLRELKQPSFIGRRQQHHQMTVETALNFMPEDSTDFAGLSLFQNEAYHLSMGITMVNGKNCVVLQKAQRNDDKVEKVVIEKAELPETFNGHIELMASSKEGMFSFSYKTGIEDWNLLKDNIDMEYLSTEKAGGFIGTIIGLYASGNE